MVSLATALFTEVDKIDKDRAFVDLGLDSIVGVEWVRSINSQYGLTIPATKVYDYANIKEFAEYLSGVIATSSVKGMTSNPKQKSAEQEQAIQKQSVVSESSPLSLPKVKRYLQTAMRQLMKKCNSLWLKVWLKPYSVTRVRSTKTKLLLTLVWILLSALNGYEVLIISMG